MQHEVRPMRTANGNAPVEQVSYLRRQAEFCLRTSQACSNRTIAEDWTLMAAEFHTRALRFEFDGALTSS